VALPINHSFALCCCLHVRPLSCGRSFVVYIFASVKLKVSASLYVHLLVQIGRILIDDGVWFNLALVYSGLFPGFASQA